MVGAPATGASGGLAGYAEAMLTLPLLLTLALSCKPDASPEGTGDVERGACNPVDPAHCMLPFPSSFFLTEDDTTGSGFRVDLDGETLPVDIDGVALDPAPWNQKDGFPITAASYAYLPGATMDGLPTHQDIPASLAADAPTLLLDAETGEAVPHWMELDHTARDAANQMLLLRPAVPLEHGRRYVVALRGVTDGAGGAIDAPDGFAALRDGDDLSADPDLARAAGPL